MSKTQEERAVRVHAEIRAMVEEEKRNPTPLTEAERTMVERSSGYECRLREEIEEMKREVADGDSAFANVLRAIHRVIALEELRVTTLTCPPPSWTETLKRYVIIDELRVQANKCWFAATI